MLQRLGRLRQLLGQKRPRQRWPPHEQRRRARLCKFFSLDIERSKKEATCQNFEFEIQNDRRGIIGHLNCSFSSFVFFGSLFLPCRECCTVLIRYVPDKAAAVLEKRRLQKEKEEALKAEKAAKLEQLRKEQEEKAAAAAEAEAARQAEEVCVFEGIE